MAQPQREDAYEMSRLNNLFAASSVVLAVCIVWMWADDELRPWKTIQRTAADVEERRARGAAKLQDEIFNDLYGEDIEGVAKQIEAAKKAEAENKTENDRLKSEKAAAEDRAYKADLVYQPKDQAVQEARSVYEHALGAARKKALAAEKRPAEEALSAADLHEKYPEVKAKFKRVKDLEEQAEKLKRELDTHKDAAAVAGRALKEAEEKSRKLAGLRRTFENETQSLKSKAEKAKYGLAQRLSDAPLLNALSPTLRPYQEILDFPDARNFDIYVKKFDRCTTCHVNIQKPEYSLELYDGKVSWAQRELDRLKKADADKVRVEDPFELRLTDDQARTLEAAGLKGVVEGSRRLPGTDRRPVMVDRKRAIDALEKALAHYTAERSTKIEELIANPALKAHPNLELFLKDGTPHPLAKVGCTICHLGDGHRTDFQRAAHTPDPAAHVVAKTGEKVIVKDGENRVRDRETGALRLLKPEDGSLIRQQDHWKKKYGWKPNDLYYWEDPMLPASYVESSCLQCHFHVVDLPKEIAPKLNLAHRLIRDNACYGCHAIRGNERDAQDNVLRQIRPDFDEEAAWKRGPSLENIHLKWNFEEAARWVLHPKGVRPNTRMPAFFKETEKGEDGASVHKFLLNHRTDPDMPALDDATVLAISAFLFDGQFAALDARGQPLRRAEADRPIVYNEKPKSLPNWVEPPAYPAAVDEKTFGRKGEPKETFHQAGKRLFVESGCLACHSYAGLPKSPAPLAEFHHAAGDAERTGPNPSGPFGPELTGLHFKLHAKNANSRKWLFNWVRSPEHYWAHARMPNLRLTDNESLAITAFLLEPEKSHHPTETGRPNVEIPAVNPFAAIGFADQALNNFLPHQAVQADLPKDSKLLESLEKLFVTLNKSRWSPAQAAEEWKALNWRDKWNETGRGMVRHYGCAGCHNIGGMEREKGIGTELSLEGSKPVKKLDFGGLEKELALIGRYTRYDWIYEKLLEPRLFDQGKYKTPLDKLKMPKFGFTPEEAKALTTYIIGLRVQPIPEPFIARYARPERAAQLAHVQGVKALEKYNCIGCHMLEPTRVTLDPRPQTRGRREDNIDWLRLPGRVTVHGLFPASFEPPESPKIAAALKADDDLKSLVDGAPFQFWRPPWQDSALQRHFRTGISAQESRRLTKVHTLAVDPGLRAQVEGLQKQNSFLQLDATSALTNLPRKDVLHVEKPWGGRLYEAIYAYYAAGEAREKAADLAREALGSTSPKDVEQLMPYALQLPKLRTWQFSDNHLKDYAAYLLYKSPPPLMGEGSKVQAAWLYQFLQNPHRIRPLVLLNMPRYKFRDGEVAALVNFFAARDGESFPYQNYPERQEGAAAARVAELFAKGDLRDDTYVWGIRNAGKVDGLTFGQFAARAGNFGATVEQARTRAWLHVGERTLFSANAGNRCVNCHRWGDSPMAGGGAPTAGDQKVQEGPNLLNVHTRLRPEYLWRWLPKPALVLPGTAMPPNWGDHPHREIGPEKDRMLVPAAGQASTADRRNWMQIAATIDLLMNPRETQMSRPGARHEAVWPEIIKGMGFANDDPLQAAPAK